MGIRIEREPWEPIEAFLRRFRRAIMVEGGFPLTYCCKWDKRPRYFHLKSSVLRRRKRWIKRARQRDGGWRYSPNPDYWWADDLELRPRRSLGRLGRFVDL